MRALFIFSLFLLASKTTSFHHLDEEEALFDNMMKTGNLQLFADLILNGTFHQLVRPTIQLSEVKPSKQSLNTRTPIDPEASDGKGSKESNPNLILREDETTTTTTTSPSTTISSTTTTEAETTPPSTTTTTEATTTEATTTEQQTTKKRSSSCCTSAGCYDPCPYQNMMPMPMQQMSYQMQQPVVLPMQTVYEPVVHDHPPLHKIKRIIKNDKRKRRKKHYTSDSENTDTGKSGSTTSTSTETDSESDGEGEFDTDIDYYGDFMHVKG